MSTWHARWKPPSRRCWRISSVSRCVGIAFVQRLKESTGMSAANVAGAYVIVRDLFRLPHWWKQIEALDYQVPAELQLQLMDELMRLGRRATRWFLRSRRNELDAARDVAHLARC